MLRVGVIGTGVMGAQHARLLAAETPGAECTAVFDLDVDRAHHLAAELGADVAATTDELLAGVDAVVVASADPTHEPLVLAALAARRPVLCEKPLAPDLAAVRRIVAAERAAGAPPITVGFMRRFDPGYRDLRAALDDDGFGRPLLVHCVHRNAAALGDTTAHSLLSSSAEHEFDILRWLLRDEIVEVTVHAGRPTSVRPNQHDPILVVLRTARDVLVDVEVFVNAGYGYEVRCEVVGENRTATLDAQPPLITRSQGTIGRAVPATWTTRFADAYRRELTAWVRAVTTGIADPNAATTADALAATTISEAAVRATQSGSPVDVEPSR